MFVLHKNLCERTSWNDRGFTSITGNPSGSWSLWTLWESKLFVTQFWNLMGFLEFLFLNLWFTKCIIAIFLLMFCAFETFGRRCVSLKCHLRRSVGEMDEPFGRLEPKSTEEKEALEVAELLESLPPHHLKVWDVELMDVDGMLRLSARGFWSALFVWS